MSAIATLVSHGTGLSHSCACKYQDIEAGNLLLVYNNAHLYYTTLHRYSTPERKLMLSVPGRLFSSQACCTSERVLSRVYNLARNICSLSILDSSLLLFTILDSYPWQLLLWRDASNPSVPSCWSDGESSGGAVGAGPDLTYTSIFAMVSKNASSFQLRIFSICFCPSCLLCCTRK